jgi:hypothetical protein
MTTTPLTNHPAFYVELPGGAVFGPPHDTFGDAWAVVVTINGVPYPLKGGANVVKFVPDFLTHLEEAA